MTKTSIILLTILLYSVNVLFAQEPFVCDGSYYLILRNKPSNQSKLFSIEGSPSLSEITFAEVAPDSAGIYLNSIGYRKTDNFIYGIDPLGFDLYKLDSQGKAFFLDEIQELDTLKTYISGDVSSDGNYLILVEGEGEGVNIGLRDVALVFIDLRTSDFTVSRIMLVDVNGQPPDTRTADIAVHPFENKLYGYDRIRKKMVTYDLESGLVDTETFSASTDHPVLIGALFFDEFSRLLGYGRQRDSTFQNTLFQVNTTTGLVEHIETGPIATDNDGCRCVNPIGLQKIVWPVETVPCTEVTYTINISNSTGNIINNVSLNDTLDPNLRFLSIIDNPFSGNFFFDTLSNSLQFSNLSLLPGIDSIVFTALVEPTASAGLIINQAEISNLSVGSESIIYSDYPKTLERQDPTPLEILAPLEGSEIYHDTIICRGEEVTLVSQFSNADYIWEDFNNETSDRITVTTGGMYVLTTIVGCQIFTEIFQVTEEWINFSLGEDQFIDLGESITISPTVQSTSPDSIYQWTGSNAEICLDCPTQVFLPLENDLINLTITNQAGCIDQDSINIFVEADRAVFVPNAFSPNGDGINDLVFASTKIPQQIAYFRIYNRWGALVFENKDGRSNDPSFGWNGTFKGEVVNNAVFVYDMLLVYLDGVQQQISGDITVIK